MRGIMLKNTLLAVVVLAIVVYLFIPLDTPLKPPAPDVTVIQFWHPWAGQYADALTRVIAEFNRLHPDIVVRPLFIPSVGTDKTKFTLAAAGGAPPDVVVIDGPDVASWAALGVLRPLDDFLSEHEITADEFFGPTWKQCRYAGRTWSLPVAADPNFALVYNKALFRQAGLDPEKPPQTFDELIRYCDRLTSRKKDGTIERLGFLPTFMFTQAHTILTYGWAFGGHFYDDATETFTCDDPRVVEALKWLVAFEERYGGRNQIQAFRLGFGDAGQNPFLVGKFAMQLMVISDANNIPVFAPNVEFGIAPMPGPTPEQAGTSWIGGWTIAIPHGDRGHDEEAFKLLHWMTVDPEGTAFVARGMKHLPALRASPYFQEIDDDRIMSAYYEILQRCRHSRPVTPANAFYMRQLDRATGRALAGRAEPAEALAEARRLTQEHLAKIRRQAKIKDGRDPGGQPSGGTGG